MRNTVVAHAVRIFLANANTKVPALVHPNEKAVWKTLKKNIRSSMGVRRLQ